MEFLKTDSQRFVNNVAFLPTGELQWISGRGTTHFLILKTPLGFHPRLSSEAGQQWLSGYEEALCTQGSFTDAARRIEGALISSAEFFRGGNRYRVSGGNVCFFVYGAVMKEQSITVFAMNNVGGDVEYSAEIQTRITAFVKPVEAQRRVGLFKTEKQSFLRVRFETNDLPADGDLYYEIEGFRYPILRAMLKTEFYIEAPPTADLTFHSRSSAKIEVKDG